jgi:hypothetical protein
MYPVGTVASGIKVTKVGIGISDGNNDEALIAIVGTGRQFVQRGGPRRGFPQISEVCGGHRHTDGALSLGRRYFSARNRLCRNGTVKIRRVLSSGRKNFDGFQPMS